MKSREGQVLTSVSRQIVVGEMTQISEMTKTALKPKLM